MTELLSPQQQSLAGINARMAQSPSVVDHDAANAAASHIMQTLVPTADSIEANVASGSAMMPVLSVRCLMAFRLNKRCHPVRQYCVRHRLT